MDWAEKYRPAHITDLVGNRDVIKRMVEWAQGWTPASKPLLLYGKPGIGKTSSAYALAYDMKWEIVELNASDQRTKTVIEQIAGEGSTTRSLSGAVHKVIILDEADNLQGNADRGGARAISEIIKHAQQPIILIANDAYGITSEIQRISEKLQFKAIQARSIAPRLKEICSQEGVNCSDEAIRFLAEGAQGDIRSAVNMLFASSIGQKNLNSEDIYISQKDHRSSIFDLVSVVYGMRKNQDLLQLSFEVDETPDKILPWIEEQVINIRDMRYRTKAYSWLAMADTYLGRTFRMQYYTLWRYASALMLFGVHAETLHQELRFKIAPPHRRSRISTARKQEHIRHAILTRLANTIHISQAHIREEYIRSISLIAAENPKIFALEFSCDADQLEYIIGDRTVSQSVVKEIEAEEKNAQKEERRLEKERQKREKPGKSEKPNQRTITGNESQSDEKPLPKTQATLFSFDV